MLRIFLDMVADISVCRGGGWRCSRNTRPFKILKIDPSLLGR